MSIKSATFRHIRYEETVEEPDLAVTVKQLFGRNLARLLDDRRMSASELARRIGAKPTMVSKWSKGINLPDAENLDKIADVFGIPMAELFVDGSKMPANFGTSTEYLDLAFREYASKLGYEVKRKLAR
jgi:transcriptional regulator with XRE-family HTH domain